MESLVTGSDSEFVLGDLEELYVEDLRRGTTGTALCAYLILGLRSGLSSRARALFVGAGGDLRVALRQLTANPRLQIGASLVLAVGLGVATIALGIEYGTYRRGLPVTHPERMIAIHAIDPDRRVRSGAFSVDDLSILKATVPDLDGIALHGYSNRTLRDGTAPPEVVAVRVASPSMFDLLEFKLARGRGLLDSDELSGSAPVVVLSHRLWERRYASDPGVIGRPVDLDGASRTVVGVLTPDARFEREHLWMPTPADEPRAVRGFEVLARLGPGRHPSEVQAALSRAADAMSAARLDEDPYTLHAVPFSESFRSFGIDGVYMGVVKGSATLLFLMALANVANLFLVRARVRAREVAVRRALGAGRLRLLRQVAIEASLPAALGIAGGGLVAAAGLEWYQQAQEAYIGGPSASWRVYRFGAPHLLWLTAGSLFSTLVVSVVAGLGQLLGREAPGLAGGRGTTSGFRLGHALVAVEVAVGGALLLLAALMIRSAWNLQHVDWGFERASILTGHLVLDPETYPEPDDRLRFWAALDDGLTGVPGVRSATLATQLPMIRFAEYWGARRPIEVAGWELEAPAGLPRHYAAAVTASFFETFGKELISGRGLTSSDDADSDPVVVVNEDFARLHFAGESPIGGRLRLWRGDEPGPWRRIVGVAPHLWMDTDENRRPQGVYVPLAQAAPREASLAIRVDGSPRDYVEAVRQTVWRLDPSLAISDLRTMHQLIQHRTRLYRRDGPAFIVMGLAALLLALVGLYAVTSYIASLRTREFGIRSALGASRRELVTRSLKAGLPAVACGSVVGILVGLGLTNDAARFLFLVEPNSVAVTFASASVLLLTALGAALIPALRASRPDVVRILKDE